MRGQLLMRQYYVITKEVVIATDVWGVMTMRVCDNKLMLPNLLANAFISSLIARSVLAMHSVLHMCEVRLDNWVGGP